ncbi:CAP domain-containing protein [Moorena sp. SIO3H5]|uniref:CAP domain-containing protein n=1 Tax=Moorena sp. SIO3H5 TaxID=2607834 RepID=UPI0013BC0503|nr:CAP domain-containing protein [Moorena sp. SIO3H5]NEO69085.1 hypothetical protein [Moorena sp. SIO3H5]
MMTILKKLAIMLVGVLITTAAFVSIPSDPAYASLSSSEQQELLDAHNQYRRQVQPTASNMRELKWDNTLAGVAQNYADTCTWGHNRNRTQQAGGKFSYLGENLYLTTNQNHQMTAPVDSWYNEVKDYDYATNSSSGVTGHYTQVVWAKTEYLGCGRTKCPSLAGLNWKNVAIVVCNYGQGGNYRGQKPYLAGATASSCPSGYTASNGLCSAN